MNIINHTLLLLKLRVWKFREICGDIDVNADPLAELKDNSDTGVDKYMQQFIRNAYSVIETVFVTGIVISALYILIKISAAKEGKVRSEGKSDFAFKIVLVVAFFALIPIVNALISAVKNIVK